MSNNETKQDISLTELVKALYQGKIFIAIGSICFMVISVAIALYLPNQYKSTATLIINTESSSKLASLAGSLSGLAGAAGINFGTGQEGSNPLIAKQLVSSKAFILDFVEKNQILVPIMAAKSWDAETNTLVIDQSKYDQANKVWLIGDNPSQLTRPKRENIVKQFKDIIKLSEDKKTGVLTFSAEFFSPQLAQQWLQLFIEEINETIRKYDVDQATKSIEYLTDLVQQTKNAHFAQTFNSLIEEQTKKLMLSKVRLDYVFKTIDPPNLPEKKSKPSRAIICVVGSFLGFSMMCFLVLVRYFYKQ